MSFTSGKSFTWSSILTYWEPWPGKRSATGNGGCEGALGAAAGFAAVAAGFASDAGFGLGCALGFDASDFAAVGSQTLFGSGALYNFRLLPMPSGAYQPGGVSFSACSSNFATAVCLNLMALSRAVCPVLGSCPELTLVFTCGSAPASSKSFTQSSRPANAAMWSGLTSVKCMFRSPLKIESASPVLSIFSRRSKSPLYAASDTSARDTIFHFL
mmetsp:Transcript_7674/g.20582  ORF Transcript_7674/g.20582 Transcript_7674/m.20582 type:complete len:214 (+) Transcript_7674:1303-1944(+)